MSQINISEWINGDSWPLRKKIAFRFLFIFFAIIIIPVDGKYYRDISQLQFEDPVFVNFFKLAHYMPQFFAIEGSGNWLIVALIAAVGTVIWTIREKETGPNYRLLNYWLRVALRYRLAAAVIAYGLFKLFPMQMPFPSLSNLHTQYGDFLPWKIYYHTVSIAQGYEVFLGAVEIAAGLLLLHRKTVTFGAGIILGFVGNVAAANIAYDMGETYYSLTLFVFAVYLFLFDLPRLVSMLILGKYTVANKFNPSFNTQTIRYARKGLKSTFFIFILLFGISSFAQYRVEPVQIPQTPGLRNAYGYYNVSKFKINNREIPYSLTDPDRWQNVVFEKWATTSIKIARPVKLDMTIPDVYDRSDIDRNYESAGVAGRHYYSYVPDTTSHTLALQNKNKNHAGEFYKLNYRQPNDSTIIVWGINEKNDSIYAQLDKITRKYLLFEGRRKRVTL